MIWKQNEINCLEQNFPTVLDVDLAKIIDRPPNALRIKASRLGIRKEITLIRNNLKLTNTEEQLIIGGLLGDLHCRITRTSKNARLEGGHCLKQKEYMLWKINLMKRLLFDIRKTKINTYLYQSKNFKSLNKYYNLFYREGFKFINKNILDLLNDFGLLIWYLDDGYYRKRDKSMCLHTNGFSFKEQEMIKDWFKEKYNVDPNIHKYRDQKRYPNKTWYYLYFRVNDTRKLLNLFQKFEVPDCMKYKLGLTKSCSSIQMKLEN